MFDQLKGMANIAGLMKDLPKIKASIDKIKEELADLTVEAETGGGAVKVTANGHMKVVQLKIDQPLLNGLIDSSNPEDRVLAEDLIAGAVNTAMEKARLLAQERIAAAAQELNLPIPPGSLGRLLT